MENIAQSSSRCLSTLPPTSSPPSTATIGDAGSHPSRPIRAGTVTTADALATGSKPLGTFVPEQPAAVRSDTVTIIVTPRMPARREEEEVI